MSIQMPILKYGSASGAALKLGFYISGDYKFRRCFSITERKYEYI